MNSRHFIAVAIIFIAVIVSSFVVRTTDDEFKNLKVLPKNITVDSLNEIMDSYKKALGVKCGFCHVMRDKNGLEDYASDSVQHKEAARDMMRMTMDLNKRYFPSGQKYVETVTCNTCHKGKTEPE